jgi:hypothetical protein
MAAGALLVIFEVPGMTMEQYEQVLEEVQPATTLLTGFLYHIAAPTPDGWMVVEVWKSEEELGEFQKILMPILEKKGITVQPKVFPSHNIVSG